MSAMLNVNGNGNVWSMSINRSFINNSPAIM
jgi:hypothetical protein